MRDSRRPSCAPCPLSPTPDHDSGAVIFWRTPLNDPAVWVIVELQLSQMSSDCGDPDSLDARAASGASMAASLETGQTPAVDQPQQREDHPPVRSPGDRSRYSSADSAKLARAVCVVGWAVLRLVQRRVPYPASVAACSTSRCIPGTLVACSLRTSSARGGRSTFPRQQCENVGCDTERASVGLSHSRS